MPTIDRRTFFATGARAGIALCGLCACGHLPGLAEAAEAGDEPIDPAARCYCGYVCPKDCKFNQGTLKNDEALKREAWKTWEIEERFGLEFDADLAICYGCKTLDKPEGIVLQRCDVRACAQKKNLECCIECDELVACDRDLWRRFPKFKEQVVEMQSKYRAQNG